MPTGGTGLGPASLSDPLSPCFPLPASSPVAAAGSGGNITITDGVTSVTAIKGFDANNSIGAGYNGSCGSVRIGSDSGGVASDPYIYQP